MIFLAAKGWREKLHQSSLNHSLFSSFLISLIFNWLEIPLLLHIKAYARQGTFTNIIIFSLLPFLFLSSIFSFSFSKFTHFLLLWIGFSHPSLVTLDFLLRYSWWVNKRIVRIAFLPPLSPVPSLFHIPCLCYEVWYLSKRTEVMIFLVWFPLSGPVLNSLV